MKALTTIWPTGVFALLGLAFGSAVMAAQPDGAAGATDEDPMQFARGAQTWAATCARCHNMRDPKELRDDQWRAVVVYMRVRANMTGQEARDVLAFLQRSN